MSTEIFKMLQGTDIKNVIWDKVIDIKKNMGGFSCSFILQYKCAVDSSLDMNEKSLQFLGAQWTCKNIIWIMVDLTRRSDLKKLILNKAC